MKPLFGSIGIEYSPDDGFIAFKDGEKPILIYNSPTVLLPGNKTTSLPLEWDSENNAIAVALPQNAQIPFVVSFDIHGKLPEAKTQLDVAIPPVRAGGPFRDEEEESGEDMEQDVPAKGIKRPTDTNESQVPRVSKKLSFPTLDFSAKFPAFRLNKSWLTTLYGPDNATLSPVTQSFVHQDLPSLNGLKVGLLTSGEVEFGTPGWKIKFLPSFSLTNAKLLSRPGLQVLRGDDGETGISFDKGSSRHFFVFLKAPTSQTFSLALEVFSVYSTFMDYY